MTEKWAQVCAKYEQGGAAEYLKAALEYEKRSENGWSAIAIADAVTDGGFPIHASTVKRRLAAIAIARNARARANSKAFLEAFAEAYAGENARGRGGQTPLDPEERRQVYLQGVTAEFDRLFGDNVPYALTDAEFADVESLRDKCNVVLAHRTQLEVVG